MKTLLYEIYYQTKLYMRAKETIFWNFAFPVFMLIIFGFVFRQNKPISLKVGVVNLDHSIGSREFLKGLHLVPNFKISEGDSAALFSRLKNRKLDYVLLFPQGFTKEIGQNRARFFIYKSDPSPIVQQIATSIFQDVVHRANRAVTRAAEPISFKEIEITSREKRMRYVDYFLPGLIAMIVISTGLFTIGIAITSYREKQVLRRLKVTPLPTGVFFAGQVVSRYFLVLFQALLLMFFGRLLFHTHFAGNWLVFLLVLSLGILSFVSLGFAISSFSRKTETAVMVSNAVFFPMLFLSGIFFPLSSMPKIFVTFSKIIPATYLADALRKIMVYGEGLSHVELEMGVLALWLAGSLIFSIKFFRWE